MMPYSTFPTFPTFPFPTFPLGTSPRRERLSPWKQRESDVPAMPTFPSQTGTSKPLKTNDFPTFPTFPPKGGEGRLGTSPSHACFGAGGKVPGEAEPHR